MRYAIEEHFIDQVERKLNRISKKCKANGNDFHYERVGEEVREKVEHNVYRGKVVTRYRFIIIDVEGTAKVGNYELVAALEIHNSGNVIRRVNTEIELPIRFRHSENVCEHCRRLRNRRELYIVHNLESNEFKQVGGDCLNEYTNGLSAEYVASYMDVITELEAYNNFIDNSIDVPHYYNVKDVIAYAVEITNKMGYFNSQNDVATKHLVTMMLATHRSFYEKISQINKHLNRYRFNVSFDNDDFHKPETEESVSRIIQYYKTIDNDSEFVHNVKVLLNDGYAQANAIGFLAYLPEGYNKYLQREIKKAERIKQTGISEYYGEIKKRYKEVEVSEVERVAAYDSDFGETYVYKIVLRNGEILIWRTSKYIAGDDMTKIKTVTFTVKSHSEYKGEKQTEITRAKVA